MTTHPVAAPVPQPFLHELVTCLRAPTVALSGRDGQIRPGGAEGVFRHDQRILSELTVEVDGDPPVPVGHDHPAPGSARFVGIVRHLGDPIADPTARLERERRIRGDGIEERLVLVNASRRTLAATIRCRVAVDFASMAAVKGGVRFPPLRPSSTGPDACAWHGEHAGTIVRPSPVPDLTVETDGAVRMAWPVELAPGSRCAVTLTLTVTEARAPAASATTFLATAEPVWPRRPTLTGPGELVRLFERGIDDLEALALADPEDPRDVFLAAGSPWFLTLFGRDSLWAARLALPLGTGLAGGTLRALARRQGRRHDPDTAEAPGRIAHEVRAEGMGELPSVYFGTVDATALWVCLLHDAWRWGMPAGEVADLLDPLQSALGWLLGEADSDGDGFLEYVDLSGQGLANQGWKDSGDSIQFPDGTIATPPIALSEAQAYAYQAGMAGAELLEAFGRPGGERVRVWAWELRDRFRRAFWVQDARGRFPAIALDGAKRPVDVASSNLGHLLGTGLLDPPEAKAVAARLAAPDLDCGFGLRTLSADAAAFNPLGYHTGAVWPHDTAIAVQGLVREGHPDVAVSLADGLLRAAPAFDHRLPELFAAIADGAGDRVLAYPAACRPQAWSAAAPVALLSAALGLSAGAPGQRLTVRARPEFAAWYPLRVEGLRLAGEPVTISVDSGGSVLVDPAAPVDVLVDRG